MTKIRVLILNPLITKEDNFIWVPPKEAGLPWWRCILHGKRPVKKRVSITSINRGVRTFYELEHIPSVFDKVTLPVVVHNSERVISLVVTKVTPPKKLSGPFLIHTAFDLGFPRERMEVCSSKDISGNIEPTYAWWLGHGMRFTELWKDIHSGNTKRLTVWCKEKTIPNEAR